MPKTKILKQTLNHKSNCSLCPFIHVSISIDENLVNCVEDCGDGNGDGEMESFEFLGKMIMDHDPIFSEIQV